MAGADFRSLFSQEPRKSWRSGLGPRGGSWQVRPDTPTEDAAGEERFEAFRKAWRRGGSPADLFGDSAFRLGGAVGGDGAPNRRADVARIETFLADTGHYKPLKDGPSGYVNDGLVEAIRAFQKDKGLPATGTIDPVSPVLDLLLKLLDRPRVVMQMNLPRETPEASSVDKSRGRGVNPGFPKTWPPSGGPGAVPLPVARPGEGRIEPLSQRTSGRSLLSFSGSDDTAGQGGGSSGMVHVRAYEQNRDGREVQVSEYDRHSPEGSGGSGQSFKKPHLLTSEKTPQDIIKSANGGWISSGPDRGSKECVALVKDAVPGLGPTGKWKAGDQIQSGSDLSPGTPIAKGFDEDGNYPSKSSGNHAALFVRWEKNDEGSPGMVILDQWAPRYDRNTGKEIRRGKPAGERWISLEKVDGS